MIELKKTPKIVLIIWAALLVSIACSPWARAWSSAFVSVLTLIFTALPIVFQDRFEIKLPSLFLGEVRDYYGRFW